MATSIYPTILSKINTILSGITEIKELFAYPASKITKYPAVIYFPYSFDNQFDNSQENFKTYVFKIFVVVGATQKSLSSIYSSILPNAIDAVLEAFDEGWNFDTIDGHRAWARLNTGQWIVSGEQDGLEVSAEIDLTVKVLTNN